MVDVKDITFYNILGTLIYDGVIGSYLQIQQQLMVAPFVMENNEIFGFDPPHLAELRKLQEDCGYSSYIDKYFKFPPPAIQPPELRIKSQKCAFYPTTFVRASDINPCFNSYEISQPCPILGDVLADKVGFYDNPSIPPTTYFNRPDVKKAIHAPSIKWEECTGPVFVGTGGKYGNGDTSLDPIQKALPQVIEATNRVLVVNGDYDMVIITQGTLVSIQNMTWNGKLGFQTKPSKPIFITGPNLQYNNPFLPNKPLSGQGDMGIQHFERGLMWAETFQAGHEGPQYQPRSSYRHLQWLLGYVDSL